MDNEKKPARFILKNSKGHPDFVMTMLVAFSLALFLLLLFWVMLNVIGLLNVMGDGVNSEQMVKFIDSFNKNLQLVVIGLSSSVFGLAGTYYLRRKSYDQHYLEKQKTWHNMGDIVSGIEGFVDNKKSTLSHKNYDDEEEDI